MLEDVYIWGYAGDHGPPCTLIEVVKYFDVFSGCIVDGDFEGTLSRP